MRSHSALLIVLLAVMLGSGAVAGAQSCTGLACQQVTCPGNGTTSITGNVYAPNGTDPLPNVTVYIPNAAVQPFTPGVSCPVVGTPPSGSPLIGTVTNADGSFELINAPVGANIPLVIISGRWRRQLTIPGTTACANTALPANFAVMPQNQSQGDIPKIAIATGSADQAECVLLKMGISQSEFTDPSGTGRINFFAGGGATGSGAILDFSTPTQASLMGNLPELDSYDMLMLPCEGGQYDKPAQELANLIDFANAGGRVYTSHFGYTWMFTNPPFSGVANWLGRSIESLKTDPGTATVNTNFTAGQTLSQWLQLPAVNASSAPGQMTLSTLREDQTGVNPPTQTWLTLNDPSDGDPVMQFVFDTPIAPAGQTINQCGRVLYNEYHVENSVAGQGSSFPGECNTSGAMTPQEKLLEYMLFELTNEGGAPSLAPASQDFGSEAVGFTTAPQTFIWMNNSSFTSQISSATTTGDFAITGNNCSSVVGGASCQITVVFTPTALGARTGTLNVVSAGNTLTASLTGTGTPGYSLSANSLSFGSLDVGASATQTLTLTSLATGPLPVPAFVTTGEYSLNTAACGGTLPAGANCLVKVTFLPTTTGPQNGSIGVNSTSLLYSGLSVSLTGNGIDFTLVLNPTSGSVVAGDGTTTTATLTPIAGFAAPVSVTCTLGATASACGLGSASVVPPAAVIASFTTTSQYTVVGYGVSGGRGCLWLFALASGCLLWGTRRRLSAGLRSGLLVALLAAIGVAMTGCSGKLPAQNPAYTGPGNYTITVSATDGFLVRSATYSLTVTSK